MLAKYRKTSLCPKNGLGSNGKKRIDFFASRRSSVIHVSAVLGGFRMMAQIREQVQVQDRNRDLGKGQSKGIER